VKEEELKVFLVLSTLLGSLLAASAAGDIWLFRLKVISAREVRHLKKWTF
jgi:hypothetical protein